MTSESSKTLLARLSDPGDEDAWGAFCDRYRPVILSYVRRLQPADAEDIAQDVLVAFVRAWQRGRYDPGKGRLRHWLGRVAKRKAISRLRKSSRRERQAPHGSGTGFFEKQVDPRGENLELVWEQEWQRFRFDTFVERVSLQHDRKTLRAFELHVFKDKPAREVAEELGMTVNAVHQAKKRLYEKYKQIYRELEEGL